MTLRKLTVEDLGGTATEEDLAQFRRACAIYLRLHPEADEADAIADVWGEGDFVPRMMELLETEVRS